MARRILSRNLWRQIVALIVAVGLWALFGGRKDMERALRVPLEFTNLPAGIEMTGEVPSVADIRVRGSEAALARMVPGELIAVVDLSTARPGPRLFHITGDDVRGPSGVTVVQVTPSNIAVGFEPTVSKLVPVVPAVQGVPAYGYEVGAITADPARVEVFGPAGALNALQAVASEPVSVSGASATVHDVVTLGVADRTLRLSSAKRATVSVEIRPAAVERIVSGVQVGVRGGSGVPAVTTVTVTLKGLASALDTVAASGLRAWVDVAGARKGSAPVKVTVEAPAGVDVVGVEPASVPVQVR